MSIALIQTYTFMFATDVIKMDFKLTLKSSHECFNFKIIVTILQYLQPYVLLFDLNLTDRLIIGNGCLTGR